MENKLSQIIRECVEASELEGSSGSITALCQMLYKDIEPYINRVCLDERRSMKQRIILKIQEIA